MEHRIVVVDDDDQIRTLVGNVLRPAGFDVLAFADAREALVGLAEAPPDLIVCDVLMPEMDGRTFLKVVRTSDALKRVPFLFLSGVESKDEIAATLEAGADDFVGKPFHPRGLVAKIRAMLRRATLAAVERPQDALAGVVSEAGTLPLLKFCEDSRLSGRLSIEAEGQTRWAEFLGGELVQAGGAALGQDAFDGLLAVTEGRYRIEQRRLDPAALRDAEERVRLGAARIPMAAADDVPLLPGGRLSRVDVRGTNVEIQTEGENRPNFTVTTVVDRGGQVLRKIETAWQHPLQRTADQELARVQIDRQHERVVATIRELTLEGSLQLKAGAGDVDASLLAWAVSFVGEQARLFLGSVMTVALLRRAYRNVARECLVLSAFRILEDGRVVAEAAVAGRVPRAAVDAAAAWIVLFLSDAAGIVEKVGTIRVRQVTRMMEADLEQIGFYAALEGARGD